MDLIKGLEELVAQKREEQRTTDFLAALTVLSSGQMTVLDQLLQGVRQGGQRLTNRMEDPVDRLGLMRSFEQLSRTIEMLVEGSMPPVLLREFVNARQVFVSIAEDFCIPFNTSPAVIGALVMADNVASPDTDTGYRKGSMRYWIDALNNKPTPSGSLQDNMAGLVPVAFNSRIIMSDPQTCFRLFGDWPTLFTRGREKIESLLREACKRWSLTDAFAYCPVPQRCADATGDWAWFAGKSWDVQQQELAKLHRSVSSKNVLVRPATLPEIMFLDCAMQLGSGMSPFSTFLFRCEHPTSRSHCLVYYNGVNGPFVTVEHQSFPDDRAGVLPIFFRESEPPAEKKTVKVPAALVPSRARPKKLKRAKKAPKSKASPKKKASKKKSSVKKTKKKR